MKGNSCYLETPFMGLSCFLLVLYLQLIPSVVCQGEDFVSIDCGGSTNHTDPSTGLMWISDSSLMRYGNVSRVKNSSKSSQQYTHYRYFPADSKKYCYTLSTVERKRYLVRATFLYGSSDNHDTYPKFKLYLDGTRWSDIVINDASTIYNKEMIIRATSTSIYVCLCCASTGFPFISTVELRPLKFSMYVTDFEDDFYLKVAARINFGASSKDGIRYPDDPYDRIWESDLNRRPNFLVGADPGTKRIATSKKIKTDAREFPPVKVMQTAVVGTNGSLSYRLDLEGFPANARAYAYLAEIEDLGPNETRKFRIQQPNVSVYNNAIVNIAENANGSYALYEPSFMNVSLDFVLPFVLVKTADSTLGPLLNAIEIGKYVQIIPGTSRKDVIALDILWSMCSQNQFTQTNGDPCVPVPWDWVNCSLDTPPRITKVSLSQRNLEGKIPPELKQMEGLTELWLDGNLLTGSIPDLSDLINLRILHLENNRLTGQLPSYLGDLRSLQELHIENNSLSGEIPLQLLSGRLIFNYDGNPELIRIAKHKHRFKQELIFSVTAFIVLLLTGSLLLLLYLKKKTIPQKNEKGNHPGAISKTSTFCSLIHVGSLRDKGPDVAPITLAELEEATQMFSKKIGEGSFGPVYYGKMQDGKEVAVKVLADSSAHGTQQFENEVALLSRIHHRNLVPLIGYCKEDSRRILIYEYMHNGTLGNHLHGSTNQQHLDWLSRLIIAEDAAKGLEYLHCGCKPSIIHRDVKTSNILLDINMRAKVSDFGLSRQMGESSTHISSIAKGTVGYLDPEYCANQQLSEKSDVYSFGVVLLELISGRKPVSKEDYGAEWSIVHWARSLIHKGNVKSIIDPRLEENFKIESVWRVAEIAILSIEQHGACRPRMQEVVFAIQDAIKIEKGIQGTHPTSFSFSIQSTPTQSRANMLNTVSSDSSSEGVFPTAR